MQTSFSGSIAIDLSVSESLLIWFSRNEIKRVSKSSYLGRNVRRRRYFVMCKYLISIKEMSEFRAIHVDHTLMYKDLKRRCTTIISLILVSVTTAACLNSLVSVSN